MKIYDRRNPDIKPFGELEIGDCFVYGKHMNEEVFLKTAPAYYFDYRPDNPGNTVCLNTGAWHHCDDNLLVEMVDVTIIAK